MSQWYVYALVDRRMPRRRIHGHAIEAVAAGGIYAMAERMRRAPELTEANLIRQHDIVRRLASAASAILPARFGSLLEHAELERIVHLRGPQLRAAFDLVRGCEQMTVRLAGAEPLPPKDVSARRASPPPTGTEYLQQRREAAGYPLPDAVARLNAAVRALVRADRAEPGRFGVRAIVYHLIERKRRSAYRRAIAAASAHAAPFEMSVTGPFPPFAFAPELLE